MWRYPYLLHKGERLAAKTGRDGGDVEMLRHQYLLHRGQRLAAETGRDGGGVEISVPTSQGREISSEDGE